MGRTEVCQVLSQENSNDFLSQTQAFLTASRGSESWDC
jgi:hypothetical protein